MGTYPAVRPLPTHERSSKGVLTETHCQHMDESTTTVKSGSRAKIDDELMRGATEIQFFGAHEAKLTFPLLPTPTPAHPHLL